MAAEPAVKYTVGKVIPFPAPGQNIARADSNGSEPLIAIVLPGVFFGVSGQFVAVARHAFNLHLMVFPLDVNVRSSWAASRPMPASCTRRATWATVAWQELRGSVEQPEP